MGLSQNSDLSACFGGVLGLPKAGAGYSVSTLTQLKKRDSD